MSDESEEKQVYVPSEIMKFFKHDHLPDDLKAKVAPVCAAAVLYDVNMPPSQQKDLCLVKLLEAKDCVIRSCVI